MSVTFVTAYFELEEQQRSTAEYFAWFEELAATGVPILVFLDERCGDRVYPLLKKFSNVSIAGHFDFFKVCLVAQKLSGWTEVELPKGANLGDSKEYLMLMNSKLEFLQAASMRCSSTHLAWIDFGIFRIFKDKEKATKRLQEMGRHVWFPCIRVPGCWPKNAEKAKDLDHVNWRFCGGFLFADRENISKLVQEHRRTLDELRPKLTWEVNIWALMEARGQHFDWYQADHNDSILDIPGIMS